MTMLQVTASRTAAAKNRNARSFRMWAGILRWTSLVSTPFLLILCIAGSPLIFRAKSTKQWNLTTSIEVSAGHVAPTLDSIVAATLWSFDAAIAAAHDVLPATRVMAVFFPGAAISPPDHYGGW